MNATVEEKGNISIHTENIFPIIKKFLYSDHEIFLRELVSNAVDASQKLRQLAALGEYQDELGTLEVHIKLDKEARTITISDNGIGMSGEEIKKYINQIAFSGASEFVEKYKDRSEANTSQIIGHFGLGFYSAFMVADQVELLSRSYKADTPAARWSCDGSTSFELSAAEREARGTDVILHINQDSEEFLDSFRIKQILTKYCKFLPINIVFEEETINHTLPLWTRSPIGLTDQDYIDFYKQLYPSGEEPLFWIHLNVDYPFNLTGILYFPKYKKEFETNRDKIQLYSRQVFITDEVKDIVPEFLLLLHGVIDSPDIPLNVSRSFLQADGNVKKINAHITKKVADKLAALFNEDRSSFEQKWESLGLFVKYGMISDQKFYDKAKDFLLLNDTEHNFYTIEEYRLKTQDLQTDKTGKLIWLYTHSPETQSTYIEAATRRHYQVLLLDHAIDSHLSSTLERNLENVSLVRVDSAPSDKLIEKQDALDTMILSDEEKTSLETLFKDVCGEKAKIEVVAMATDDAPVMITLNEFGRRMQDMYAGAGGGMAALFGEMGSGELISINANHGLTSKILASSQDQGKQRELARHAYDLALLAQNKLTGLSLAEFMRRSIEMAGR